MRKFFLSLFLLLICATGGIGLWYFSYLTTPAPGSGEVRVIIPKGAGVRGIGSRLAEQGLLRDDVRFLALVYTSKLATKLQAGEYGIPRGLTPPQVLRLLEEGKTIKHQVTVPEGLTARQIGEIFARDGWVQAEEFQSLVENKEFAARLGVQESRLEGYLFPETYTLDREGTAAATVITMMVRRYFHVWQQLDHTSPQGLNDHEVLTLASIVEKETGAAFERPLIARVFLNRLQRRMRLQSDPTVIYGIKDFDGNLTRKDLRTQTPYNTYTIFGLPPGPICNPGKEALEAVLHPATSKALYFVSRNDGTHIFSNSLKAHNKAVNAYQRSR